MPHEDFLMICPYFHKTLGNTLFCTAVPAVSDSPCTAFHKQNFEERNARNLWIKNYCASFNYGSCRYAVLNKYLFSPNVFHYLP